MRKYVIAIALAAAFYIDTVLFGVFGSPVFWPNTVLAVIAALSVMGGAAPFAAVGIGIGFVIDVVYNKYIGLTSLSLLIAALAGGAFYNKFYADNVIVPAGVAAVAYTVKEHILLFTLLISGGNLSSYFMLLLTHILPSAVLTGGFAALAHVFFQKSSVQVALASRYRFERIKTKQQKDVNGQKKRAELKNRASKTGR